MLRWLRDPQVAVNLGLRTTPTLAKTRAFVAAAANKDAVYGRAILLGEEHVGTVVLDQIDRRVGRARLHIYIGEATARGRGVGTRAVTLAVELAFEDLELHKVWLTVHARNAAALRAYQRVGFMIEGTHRDEFLLDGERVDEIYMGVINTGSASSRTGPP